MRGPRASCVGRLPSDLPGPSREPLCQTDDDATRASTKLDGSSAAIPAFHQRGVGRRLDNDATRARASMQCTQSFARSGGHGTLDHRRLGHATLDALLAVSDTAAEHGRRAPRARDSTSRPRECPRQDRGEARAPQPRSHVDPRMTSIIVHLPEPAGPSLRMVPLASASGPSAASTTATRSTTTEACTAGLCCVRRDSEHDDRVGVRSRDTGSGVYFVAPTADATRASTAAASRARTTESAPRASPLGPAGPFARTTRPTTTRRGHRASTKLDGSSDAIPIRVHHRM
jgi:hypothetical protein